MSEDPGKEEKESVFRDLDKKGGGIDTIGSEDQPHKFADSLYDAICKDTEEKPTNKGGLAFRDQVFEQCTQQQVLLRGARMGVNAASALVKLVKQMPVKRIDLQGNNLNDEGIKIAIHVADEASGVQYLNLGCNNMQDQGALEVARMLAHGCSLWSLELGSPRTVSGSGRMNLIDSKAGALIAKSLVRNKTLLYLGLRGNEIGVGSAQASETFAVMLTRNKTLTALNLEENQLGTRGASVIIAALAKNTFFRHLMLNNNNIGPEAGRTIEAVLSLNSSLCSLRLQNNNIAAGCLPMAQALCTNQSLLILDLTNNSVGDNGAEAFAKVLLKNRTLTHINLANNGITEKGGKVLAMCLSQNPVLHTLNLSGNGVKNVTAIALAEGVSHNESLVNMDLSSCKIGDEGVIYLVTAVSNNKRIALRKLLLRDNFISSQSGELIVDAFNRNTSLTHVDLRGNQVDHVRLNKVKSICARNCAEIKDAEPRRLRKEIARLRGEQVKLRKAEATLKTYQKSIADTKARIVLVEQEKQAFIKAQVSRREEISTQIAHELASIEEARGRLQEKKKQLSTAEATYNAKIGEMQAALDLELEAKKGVESDLAKVKKELEETIRQRPNKVEDLKKKISKVRQDKELFQKQLSYIRSELGRLQQAYEQGKPVPELIEQARALLLQTAVSEEMEREAREAMTNHQQK